MERNWIVKHKKDGEWEWMPATKVDSCDSEYKDYYTGKTGIEVIDIIESFELGFNLGNVVKYCLRAGKKEHTIDDLKKARWYLSRQIKYLECIECDSEDAEWGE